MDEFDDDDSGTIFRDVTLLALAAFVAMVLMLLPFLNPGAEAESEADGISDPGNVIVELVWPPERDADIDLWVRAPGTLPVGFPNKGNAVVNLLRDDLGLFQDLTDINYEIVYSRGIVPGEWIVNVQAYRMENPIRPDPVRVQVVVSVKREGRGTADADPGEEGRAALSAPRDDRVPLRAHRQGRARARQRQRCQALVDTGNTRRPSSAPSRCGRVDSFTYLYVALALVAAALASIAVWSRRRTLWKAAAVGLLAALVVIGYFSYSMLLSRPKTLSPGNGGRGRRAGSLRRTARGRGDLSLAFHRRDAALLRAALGPGGGAAAPGGHARDPALGP